MQIKEIDFSLKRILFLIYYELKTNFSFIFIILTIFNLLFFSASLLVSFIEENYFIQFPYPSDLSIRSFIGIYFWAGYFCLLSFASKSFNIYHFKEKGIWYYLLPCSVLEKFFSKLFFYLIIYPMIFIITLFVFSVFLDLTRYIVWDRNFGTVIDLLYDRIAKVSYNSVNGVFFLWSLFFFFF